MKNIFPLMNQWKLTNSAVENIFSTDKSIKRQIADSDLESNWESLNSPNS